MFSCNILPCKTDIASLKYIIARAYKWEEPPTMWVSLLGGISRIYYI